MQLNAIEIPAPVFKNRCCVCFLFLMREGGVIDYKVNARV